MGIMPVVITLFYAVYTQWSVWTNKQPKSGEELLKQYESLGFADWKLLKSIFMLTTAFGFTMVGIYYIMAVLTLSAPWFYIATLALAVFTVKRDIRLMVCLIQDTDGTKFGKVFPPPPSRFLCVTNMVHILVVIRGLAEGGV